MVLGHHTLRGAWMQCDDVVKHRNPRTSTHKTFETQFGYSVDRSMQTGCLRPTILSRLGVSETATTHKDERRMMAQFPRTFICSRVVAMIDHGTRQALRLQFHCCMSRPRRRSGEKEHFPRSFLDCTCRYTLYECGVQERIIVPDQHHDHLPWPRPHLPKHSTHQTHSPGQSSLANMTTPSPDAVLHVLDTAARRVFPPLHPARGRQMLGQVAEVSLDIQTVHPQLR